jgi:soluble lytic murein transglycosylase-like protein
MKKWLVLILIFILSLCLISGYFLVQRGKNQATKLISPIADPVPDMVLSMESTLSAVLDASTSAQVSTISKVATVTATPVVKVKITPKVTPKLTIKPVSKKAPTPTPTTQIPKRASSQEINELIGRYSSQYGLDPNVIRHIAICESGFNSSAVNKQYVGLFQFDETTWKNIRNETGDDNNPDLRFSALESIRTVTYEISKGKSGLWPNCVPK